MQLYFITLVMKYKYQYQKVSQSRSYLFLVSLLDYMLLCLPEIISLQQNKMRTNSQLSYDGLGGSEEIYFSLGFSLIRKLSSSQIPARMFISNNVIFKVLYFENQNFFHPGN